MANIKVSEMTQADSVNDLDLLMIVQGNTNKKVTKQTLLEEVNNRVAESEENISALQTDLDTSKETIEQNQKDIQELQEENENLKNALPTITGTGTNITLNKTSKNKFKKFEVGGNTEQTQYEGYNICSSSQIRNNVEIAFYFDKKNIEKIFTLSFITNESLYGASVYLDKGQGGSVLIGTISGSANTRVSTTITLTDEVYEDLSNSGWYNIRVYKSNGNFNSVTQAQIENGSNLKPFEPYVGGLPSPNPSYPQAIKNVTGNVNVKIKNKNLSPINSKTITVTTNSNAQIGSINGTIIVKDIPIKNNEKYYISGIYPSQLTDAFSVFLYNGHLTANSHNGAYSELVSGNRGIQSTKATEITNSNGYEYMAITMGTRTSYNANTEVTINIENLMVTTLSDTTYVPHQEQNLPFTLASGQKLMLGDSLQDDGIHNVRGQIVLDGTEDWTDFSYTSGDDNFRVQMVNAVPNILTPPTNPADLKCNYFTAVNRDTAYIKEVVGIAQYGAANGRLFICAPISILSTQDMAGWKTWLSTHNLIVEFPLAEEETTPYTETQQEQHNAIKEAMSYYEQTNITSTSEEVGPIIDAEAIADMNSLLSGVVE